MERDTARDERDRYQELLGELRTIITGAQVLFAFLLTVPFSARFHQVDYLGKVIFLVSLICVAAAIVLFLAPTAYHRLARKRDRQGRLRFGVRTTLAGLFLLGLAVTCVIFVVVRFLFGSFILALALATTVAVLALVMWCALPLRHR